MGKNYNFERKKLMLPEYGRHIHQMVDYLCTIEDRTVRNEQAHVVVEVMGNINPVLRDAADFKHKLWDHLAIMADFKLDIDYPYEIVKKESLEVKPEVLAYPQKRIRYRHYGHILENMVKKAVEYPEGEDRKHLISLIANQMKKCFINWNKDSVEDQKILDDLREYSQGAISLSPEDLQLCGQRTYVQRRPQRNNGQRRMQQNNNQRRKY